MQATEQHSAADHEILEACCGSMEIHSGRGVAERRLRGHERHEIAAPRTHASAMLHYRQAADENHQVQVLDRHVCFIPANFVGATDWECDAQLTMIALCPDFLHALARANGIHHVVMSPQYVSVDPFLWQMVRFIERQLQVQRILEPAYLDSLAHVIGQHLLSTYADTAGSNRALGGLPHYKVRRAIDYIRTHYREDIGFKDIAQHLDMSPFHFARMFKRSTNESPHQFISRHRIDQAKKMLVESDRAIADIALEVGYKSQSHFTTRFAAWVGMTPAAFRSVR